ncbi:MAG: hypothetical protein ABIL68_05600 [bacterium]
MKTSHRNYLKIGWVVLLVIAVIACDKIIEQIEDIDVTVKEEFLSADVNEDTTSIPLIPGARLRGKGNMAKLTESGFIEVEMPIADAALFLNVLEAGGASFSGTLQNNAANDVAFGIYISTQSGLTDPQNQAVHLVTVTLTPLTTYSLDALGGFLPLMFALLSSIPNLDAVYFYLTGDGEPDVDITIANMEFHMDASVHLNPILIAAAAYARYADRLSQMTSGAITGSVTNGGTSDADLKIYISLATAGFDPDALPPASDLVAHVVIPPGRTADFSGNLVAEGQARLMERIQSLVNDGIDLWANVFITSSTSIVLQLRNISVEGRASITGG